MSKMQTAIESAKDVEAKSRAKTVKSISDSPAAANGAVDDTIPRLSIEMLPKVYVDWEVLKANRILTFETTECHPAEGAYRMLRTRLMRNLRANNWRVLGVTSIGENEGKTFTSINLATCIAAEFGQEAVLVDLDLRKPTIYRYIGVDPDDVTGLKDYLEDESRDLADLCVNPGIDRLGVLLGTDPLARSSDMLASARGTQLFAELRSRFSENAIIIVDLPPLLATDDALAVASMLDALLLVVAEGQAERKDVSEARYMLESFNLIGSVLNKSVEKDSRRTSYYY